MGLISALFGFSDKCSNCGAEVSRDAIFCGQCREPAPRAKIVCPACGAEMRGSAKFCSQCRTQVGPKSDKASPVDSLNRWKRSPAEFAHRIEAADLNSTLQAGIVVEPGTRALIFQGGALAGAVTAGTFDLSRPLPGVNTAQPATAILIDEGDTGISLLFSDQRTQEEVPVDVIAEVTVRLSDAVLFHTNLMHGRESLSLATLADMLWSAGANVVQSCLRNAAVRDLDGNLPLKTQLEQDLRTHIGQTLARNGIELVDLRFLDFQSPLYDKIRQRRAATFLAQEKVADTEQRAALNRRLREVLTSDRLHRFTSTNEFQEFVRQTEHELGMKEVIREAEMEELKRTYEEKRDDAELARKHLLEKLELEHQLAQLRQTHSINDEQLRHRLAQDRQRLQAEQDAEWAKAIHEQKVTGIKREEGLKDVRAHAEEVREKMKLADEALNLSRKREEQEHEEERRRKQLEQEEKDREAKRRMEERDQAARHELEKLRALSEVEQARLAADLKKTEIFKGMSEDQILALMAKDSPHVAAAIAERARAQAQAGAGAEVRAIYEKMLAEKDADKRAEADRMERFMGRAMEGIERVAGGSTAREREQKQEIKETMVQSMDRIADVATAKAGASGRNEATPAQVVCQHCRKLSPAGSKFCEGCGSNFFE
jgi:hypothetical protein